MVFIHFEKTCKEGSERPQCEKIEICFLIEIMANNEAEFLLQCFHRENGLDMKSKSFLCLHSLCETYKSGSECPQWDNFVQI